MIGFTLSSVEVLCLAQVGWCKTGLSDVLWLAQVGGISIGVCVNLLKVQFFCSRKPLNIYGSEIFLEQLFYLLHLYFLV